MVTQASRSIIDGFQARLEEWGAGRGLKVDWPTWWVDPKNGRSRNILVLLGDASERLLYVKVRSEPPGFWGLTQDRLGLLGAAHRKWYVVLLLESPETGYLLPSAEVERCIRDDVWKLSTDGDFKIHEAQLSRESHFQSFVEFTDKLDAETEQGRQRLSGGSAAIRDGRPIIREARRSFSTGFWMAVGAIAAFLLLVAIFAGGMSVCTSSSSSSPITATEPAP